MAEEAKDVKEEVEESTTEEVENGSESATDKGGESDFSDVELFGGQERDIPYSRFKEVNSKKKEAERELKHLQADMDSRVQDAVYKKELQLRREYENRLAAQDTTNDYGYDNYESSDSAEVRALKAEVESLKKTVGDATNEIEKDKLKRELKSLKKEYPALQEEHVMAVAKIRPNWSWEECAEYSHQKMAAHVKNQYESMVANKKEAAKRKPLGAEGIRNMKPEERPKSFQEAARKAAQYLGGD
jgi:hypothetical protein